MWNQPFENLSRETLHVFDKNYFWLYIAHRISLCKVHVFHVKCPWSQWVRPRKARPLCRQPACSVVLGCWCASWATVAHSDEVFRIGQVLNGSDLSLITVFLLFEFIMGEILKICWDWEFCSHFISAFCLTCWPCVIRCTQICMFCLPDELHLLLFHSDYLYPKYCLIYFCSI